MKTLTEIKEIIRAEKPYLFDKYGVTEIGVFGSYVRGEQHSDSDLDILIELVDPPRISLLGLVNLENYGDCRRGNQASSSVLPRAVPQCPLARHGQDAR